MNQWKLKEAMQDEMAINVKNILHSMNRQPPPVDSDHSISEEPDDVIQDS